MIQDLINACRTKSVIKTLGMHKDPNNQKKYLWGQEQSCSCKEKICILKIYISNTRPKVKKHEMPLQYQAHKNVFEKKC